MNIDLTFKKDTQVIQQQTLDQPKGSLVIGRDKECDVVLTDNAVSPKHLILKYGRNGLWAYDQGSVNGVFLNEKKLKKPTRIHTDDVLRLGATTITVDDKDHKKSSKSKDAARMKKPCLDKEEKHLTKKEADRARRVRLLLMLAVLLLLATVVVFVKKEQVLKMTAKVAASAPPVQSVQPETPTSTVHSSTAPPSTNDIDIGGSEYDVVSYMSLGQKALVDNDMIKAAYYFKRIVQIETNNVQAKQYLNLVSDGSMSMLFKNAKYSIITHDIQAAQLAIGEMHFINPDDHRLQELNSWLESENKYIAAQAMYRDGKYRDAYNVLTNLTLINDQERQKLLGILKPIIQTQDTYATAVAAFKAMDYSKALNGFAAVEGSSALGDDQTQQIAQYTNVLNDILAFDKAYTAKDIYVSIQKGQQALSEIDRVDFPEPVKQVEGKLEAIRTENVDKLEQYTQEAYVCEQQAAASDDPRQSMQYNAMAYKYLAIINFLSPDEAYQKQMSNLKQVLDEYVQAEYQQGYILESIGQYPEACKRFRGIVDLNWEDGRYLKTATEKLKQSKLYSNEVKELERAKESL